MNVFPIEFFEMLAKSIKCTKKSISANNEDASYDKTSIKPN